jgi:hypothetical protein
MGVATIARCSGGSYNVPATIRLYGEAAEAGGEMRRFTTVLASLVLLVMGLASCVGALPKVPQPPTPTPNSTAAAWARMTDAQKHHATFHRPSAGSVPLIERGVSVTTHTSPGLLARPSFDELVRASVCASDAVVQGVVVGGESFPLEDGTFLFTDYHVRVSNSLRTRPGVEVQAGEIVIVSRRGGSILVEGELIFASSMAVPPLSRSPHVLFLTQIGAGPDKAFLSSGLPVFELGAGDRATALGGMTSADDADVIGEGVSLGRMRSAVARATCLVPRELPSAPTELLAQVRDPDAPSGPDSGMHALDEAALLGLTDILVSRIARAGNSSCGFAR